MKNILKSQEYISESDVAFHNETCATAEVDADAIVYIRDGARISLSFLGQPTDPYITEDGKYFGATYEGRMHKCSTSLGKNFEHTSMQIVS